MPVSAATSSMYLRTWLGTKILHHELKARLDSMFHETLSKAQQELDNYCEQETQKELIQITHPNFGTNLEAWRMLRYARAFYHGTGGEQPQDLISGQTLYNMWTRMNLSNQERMVHDIHDVIKVYYEVRAKPGRNQRRHLLIRYSFNWSHSSAMSLKL